MFLCVNRDIVPCYVNIIYALFLEIALIAFIAFVVFIAFIAFMAFIAFIAFVALLKVQNAKRMAYKRLDV